MPKASAIVRSLPYPAVEHGNFSFPSAEYLTVPKIQEAGKNSVELEHKIVGAPFIEELIKGGKAQYGCLVSVPKTGFRKLVMSDSNSQLVSWKLDMAGEPPLLGPVILYVGDDQGYMLSDKDGVAGAWQGKEIMIPKGARLAKGRYLRPTASLLSLINVKLSQDLDAGGFKVEANTNQGFRFHLEAAKDVYDFLQNPQGNTELRRAIIVHAITGCFEILSKEYSGKSEEDSGDGWEQYSNLQVLSDWMNTKNIPHWSGSDFDSMAAATKLYPINIPKTSQE